MKSTLASIILGALCIGSVSAAPTSIKTTKVCRVHGGGHSDATPAILNAFQQCQNNSKILLEGNFLVKTLIVTPRLSNVEIELSGTITYDDNLAYWSKPTTSPTGNGSYYMTYQNATTFFFLQGDNIWLHGTTSASAFDGQGQLWWDTFAVNKLKGNAGGSSTEFARPILLAIGNSSNVLIENLSFLQGPFWHIFLTDSKDVTIQSLNISAVSHSQYPVANSDGIDVYRSTRVKLSNWNVNNGDDCVSLKPNSTSVEIGNMICNGSHGISIGSLGQYRGQTDIVKNVYVHDISMSNAQAGARIKVWPNSNSSDPASGGGLGYVKNITFANFVNHNVDQPLIITSCYNYQANYCATQPSLMTITDVTYINVTGTSSGKYKNVVGILDCSNYCRSIVAKGTSLFPPATITSAPAYNCTHIRNEELLDFKCQDV